MDSEFRLEEKNEFHEAVRGHIASKTGQFNSSRNDRGGGHYRGI